MVGPIQPALFDLEPSFPDGFIYREDVISPAMEAELIERARDLPLKPFEFHGHLGNRRVTSFGWRYDFGARRVESAEPIPDFLMAPREVAAAIASRSPEDFQQVLITEYPPGAGIGWHKDKASFGEVVGLSLASACTLRFRKAEGRGWIRRSVDLSPRSAYLLSGPARRAWEHSIPPVTVARYSITFRTLAEGMG